MLKEKPALILKMSIVGKNYLFEKAIIKSEASF